MNVTEKFNSVGSWERFKREIRVYKYTFDFKKKDWFNWHFSFEVSNRNIRITTKLGRYYIYFKLIYGYEGH